MESNSKKLTPRTIGFLILGLIVITIIYSFAFVVREDEQAVVIRFGKPVHVIAGARQDSEREEIKQQIEQYAKDQDVKIHVDFGAGIYFKIPFIDIAEFFDNRLIQYDAPPEQVPSLDKKLLVVDTFARWRISNPLLFRQSVINEAGGLSRLDDIIYSVVRDLVTKHNFNEVIRTSNDIFDRDPELEPLSEVVKPIQTGRQKIMQDVARLCDQQARSYGIRITDVRVKRADLPEANRKNVYDRMREERNRIATRYIEQGNARAQKLRAETDKQVQIMLADAYRQKQLLQGEGDAESMRIYAEGYQETKEDGTVRTVAGYELDPEFYAFLRQLEALEKIADESTTFVLSTDSELLGILKTSQQAP